MIEESIQTWLKEGLAKPLSVEEALKFFDFFPAVSTDEMIGEWKGASLATHHPLDGLLEELNWEGKIFLDSEQVHPLIFRDKDSDLYSLNSKHISTRLIPLATTMARNELVASLLSKMGPALKTDQPTARLRKMEYRGVVTATMIYDYLPIHDIFRKIDKDMVLGAMDMRDSPQPFFFILQRKQTPSSFYERLRKRSAENIH